MTGGTDIVGDVVAEGTDAGGSGRIEDLYARSVPQAARLAALITGDAALGEDIAQDAFVRAIGRFRHLRNEASFDAYLRRAIVNACASHFRHAKVERGYVSGERATARPAIAPPGNIEARDELRRALLELPPRQRTAVVLRFYGDLSEEQAGESMRCSPTAVRALVTRGMQTHRERITRSDEA